MGVVFWAGEILPSRLHQALVLLPKSSGEQVLVPNTWLGAVIIISSALISGFIVDRSGAREALVYLAAGYLGTAGLSLLASYLFAIDTLYVPGTLASACAVVFAQIVRLWNADRELGRLLFHSVNMIGLKGAEEARSRLMSGLKLLQAELDLSEAIVFQRQKDLFTVAARLRNENAVGVYSSRNSAWREGFALCERAVANTQIISEAAESGGGAMNVAVPLGHANRTMGALLLRLTSELRNEDHGFLTAVAAQIARNLQREEFCKFTARQGSVDFFSAKAGETKLEALYVLNGLLTEQRCGENALAQVTEGGAIAYLDGTLAFVNQELLRVANLTASQVKSFNFFELLDRFRTDIFEDPAIAVRRVLQSGEDYECELNFPGRNEIFGLRILLVHDRIIPRETGEPLCLAVYVRDLTHTKHYEQLKSDMISLMSHELRTPLTSINGFAELLCAEEGLPEQTKEFVNIISNESQRLSRMINTFLAVTQLERKDKQEVLKIPLRLNDVVRETILNLQSVAKKKRIRLVEQPAEKLPPVAADRSLITQAVKNLVTNAIKYSPERTTVTVSTALEAEAVRVSVEDRGFGIPLESRDRVWEKFYRVVREGQEKDEESTGLGLSFVREVVEQHGGNVDLESEEGRGSKFSFTLPRL
ncbi:MAG TPA: HAMP domain-containing sensor histidine kinase [Pyrinomonadaceae bacterium]|nr:HAMP domain-containing sensor histidine kinase [Pyrinomonadaceae bacterium]